MTAAEVFTAIQGVPAECLCRTIRYADNEVWINPCYNHVPSAHAAALHRDAMVEWLLSKRQIGQMTDVAFHDDDRVKAKGWTAWETDGEGFWHKIQDELPTRLHALAAACKYVAGQNKPEKP